jgi:hypothetical protein
MSSGYSMRELILKILQARRHAYPSVSKFHKYTQLLIQSLTFNHPIHWGNDTFAHEEDDEAEEKPLLDLSSAEMDQHKAGMYAIFKKTYRWMWKSRFW